MSPQARRSVGRLVLGLCLLASRPGVSQAAERVRINGSGTGLDLARSLLPLFEAARPGVRASVDPPLGSSGAVRALLAGALDVAVISRPLEAGEAARGARARDYGKTPLVLVTHRGVGKTAITLAELEEVFSGEVTTWPGGERIRLVLRPESETNTKLLAALSPEMATADAVARTRPWALIAVTDPEANQLVAQTPGAIGASTLLAILTEGLALNPLSFEGVEGNLATLAAGTYTLAKPITFVTTDRAAPAARAFIDFAFSAEGRRLAGRVGVLVTAPREDR